MPISIAYISTRIMATSVSALKINEIKKVQGFLKKVRGNDFKKDLKKRIDIAGRPKGLKNNLISKLKSEFDVKKRIKTNLGIDKPDNVFKKNESEVENFESDFQSSWLLGGFYVPLNLSGQGDLNVKTELANSFLITSFSQNQWRDISGTTAPQGGGVGTYLWRHAGGNIRAQMIKVKIAGIK